jgi:pepsin A
VSIGKLSAKQHIGAANNQTGIPHDGIVGFGPSSTEFPGRNATAFVETLCRDGDLSECRFGLALNSNKTGSLILGEVEPSLYENKLSVVPSSESWTVNADIYVDGSISNSDTSVVMDSGTATIVGPIDQVSAIFNSTGIQGVRSGSSLFGYFPCDKPPTLGIGLPSQSDAAAAAKNHSPLLSTTTTLFNISSDQWAIANNGHNNCTALLSGQDFGESIWIFGQGKKPHLF